MNLQYPDYNNCLVNLISSILKYFEADYYHSTLKDVDRILSDNQFKNVVLILNDGLGTNILERTLNKDDFLIKNKLRDITSVFPATTTASTTSITTGLTPMEHCWIGWYLYVADIDKTIVTYLNTLKDSNIPAADYNVPKKYFPYKSVFENINEKGKYKAFNISPYGDVKYDFEHPNDMYANITELCNNEGKKFMYAYYHNPDHLMHDYGVNHQTVKENIEYINDSIEKLCENMTDTLVIVTADHGLIDVEYKNLTDYPTLKSMLLRETSIEPRAVNFFIKPGMNQKFEIEFKKYFGEDFILLTKEQVFARNVFGFGDENIRFKSCIGDYLAIGISNIAILDEYDENPLIANHAGITEDETVVPLILINKK